MITSASDTLLTDDGSASVTLVKKNLLAKDESLGILGSAHQSIVHVKDGKGQDRYFMAYHRFYTPLNIFTAGDGTNVILLIMTMMIALGVVWRKKETKTK